MVLEMELDGVALAHADEAAGHRAAEGPECVLHAGGDFTLHLAHLELDDDLGGRVAAGGRWHEGGTREHRVHRLALRRTEIAGAGAAGVGERLWGGSLLLAAG